MQLHNYQELARDFLRSHSGAALFLEMGLGKTAATLSALEPRHLPALVVAPKRVCEHVWGPERELWRPDLTMAVAAGTPTQRGAALALQRDITVISRDNLADVSGDKFTTLILDELSGFKDHNTTRFKLAKKISARAEYRWGLTGTPTPNGLLDLWSQLFLLDRGERLGTSIGRYRSRYFRPGRQLPTGVIVEWILRPESEKNIHVLIDDICLSMEDNSRAEPTYNTVTVEMPAAARKHYAEFKKELVLDLEMLGGEIYSAANAAILTNKLAQLTAGFLYSDDGSGAVTQIHTAKLEALREIVEGTGKPILVFYHYKAEAEAIRKLFPQSLSIDDRDAIGRWNRGEIPMMLAHPASASHGLNLQYGGHVIVWMTQTWSLELWEQANGRLNRQGQEHPVVIHTIAVDHSIDKVVADRVRQKSFTQEALLDHLRSPL